MPLNTSPRLVKSQFFIPPVSWLPCYVTFQMWDQFNQKVTIEFIWMINCSSPLKLLKFTGVKIKILKWVENKSTTSLKKVKVWNKNGPLSIRVQIKWRFAMP